MSEITPPIGHIVDTSDQRCSYSPSGTDRTTCPHAATWHIAWDAQMENGLACDAHMAEVQQRWAYVDRHPIGPVCGMPGSTWYFDEKRCLIDGLDDTTVLAAHAPDELEETNR